MNKLDFAYFMEEYITELNKTKLNRGSDEESSNRRFSVYHKLGDLMNNKGKSEKVRLAASAAKEVVAHSAPGTVTYGARQPHFMISKNAWVSNR